MMETVRARWTDERLDDLNGKVDDLARRMDEGFHELRGEMNAMQRTMIQLAAVTIAALVGLTVTQLGPILTQSESVS